MSADAFSARHATAADNRLLAELGAETFFDSFADGNTAENMAAYLAQSFSPEKQALELADPAAMFLIASLGETVVGFAKLHFGPAPAAVVGRQPMEISRFYARQPWIGKGIGARLMPACLGAAAQAGCDVVWLSAWQRNPRAIDFYGRWGFGVVGAAIFHVGDDPQADWLMARRVHLDPPAAPRP